MTTHPSRLVIDGIAADLVIDREASAHIATCERCLGDLEAARAACATFTRDVLPRTIGKLQPRRVWWKLPALLVPALAAAVLVFVMVRRPDSNGTSPDETDVLRIKGGVTFQVYANRRDDVLAVRDATRLAPGDRIRFVVGSGGPAYLLVASVDGAGHATVYYPYAGMESGPVTAEPSELPGSIVLDTSPGPERVFALVSAEPLHAADVTRELLAVGARGADAIRQTRTLAIPATAQASVVFEKAAP